MNTDRCAASPSPADPRRDGRDRRWVLVTVLLFALPVDAADKPNATSSGSLFQVSGRLTAQSLSTDGRYALVAHARAESARTSGDGRFRVKSAAADGATCASTSDRVFLDGFESP